MMPEEQNAFLSKEHAESMRYMDNAEETLKRAGKNGARYADVKYVQTACGIAHLGVLRALDAWFELKELHGSGKNRRKSIRYYMDRIATVDRKMLTTLQTAYDILHLDGYYDGIDRIKVIEGGFDVAYEIIDKIKPDNSVEVAETRGDKVKRAWNKMMISLAVMFMRKPY